MTTKTKIRALENHVLPKHPEPAAIYLKNEAEISLYNRANRIRQNINEDMTALWHNNKLTLEEKQNKTMELYDTLDSTEKLLVSKDEDFYIQRLQGIIKNYFVPMFPKNDEELDLRIAWFFRQMRNLGYAKHLEDSEWYHNRNEESPDFDDFKWWDTFEAKLKKELPDRVFTEKSYEKLRDWLDEEQSKLICQYWKEHPEKYDRFVKEFEESTKKIREEEYGT